MILHVLLTPIYRRRFVKAAAIEQTLTDQRSNLSPHTETLRRYAWSSKPPRAPKALLPNCTQLRFGVQVRPQHSPLGTRPLLRSASSCHTGARSAGRWWWLDLDLVDLLDFHKVLAAARRLALLRQGLVLHGVRQGLVLHSIHAQLAQALVRVLDQVRAHLLAGDVFAADLDHARAHVWALLWELVVGRHDLEAILRRLGRLVL